MPANEYYDSSGSPGTSSAGSSQIMRAEFNAIESGFSKLPPLAGNANLPVFVNSGATGTAVKTAADARTALAVPSVADTQSSAARTAVATGTADAILGAFTPAIATLVHGMTVLVRATAANATTTPTFKADGTLAKTIVKGVSLALAAGNIAGAGYWTEFTYDLTVDKWVLRNPW